VSTSAAQLQFAAEFAVFLVAGAGLALLVLRPALLVAGEPARRFVAAGFVLVGAAAFAHGALLVEDARSPLLVVGRVAGVALLLAAPVRWAGRPVDKVACWLGVVSLACSEVALAGDSPVVSDWLSTVGAAGLGLALLLAARHSIPTRIAASASAILLAVVLATSVALSVVLSDNVEDEAVRRLSALASTEASLASGAGRTAQVNADLAAATFAQNAAARDLLLRLADPADPDAASLQAALADRLRFLDEQVIQNIDPRVGPTLLLAPDRRRLAAVGGDTAASEPVLAGIEGSQVVTEALANGTSVQSVITPGDVAYGIAAAPIRVDSGPGTVTAGVVVVTSQLDASYLEARAQLGAAAEEAGTLAFAGRDRIIASSGPGVPTGTVLELAQRVLDTGASVTRTAGGRLVVVDAVRASADGVPVLAVAAATPISTIQATREDLFRLLFLVALASTLLALFLTALVGERIGKGLRRLTLAAGEIRGGNLLVTTELDSDDELGVLSSAFDSMTGSLRAMTAELRQSAEDEARLRTRMEAVVGGMGEALIAVDDHGDVTDWNAATEVLTGVPARKAIGRPVAAVVKLVADDGTDLAGRLAQPVDDSWTVAASVVHSTGIDMPVVVSAGSLRGAQNQAVGAVFVVRDVRREREIERMKTEFIANIGHELRTPLVPIKGYSQILRSKTIPEADVRRFAGEIELASDKLTRIVEQLMNFAEMQAGRYDIRTEPVVVREVLDRVVGRWSDRLDPDRYPIVRKVARGVPKVWLDRRAIEQALNELVDNAVKYSPAGGRIRLSAVADADGERGPVVKISVADGGVGIDPAKLEAIFDDFTQADGSATRSFNGLGLGLALVERIARAHGGVVEVDSVEGQGSTFTLVLPVGES
jgi:PAS domain S-box-containing protein